jgi:hypothetical protein
MPLHDVARGDIGFDPVFFTSVTVASPGNGNTAWTTVDVSAYVPAGVRLAVMTVQIAGGTNSGSYQTNQVDFRKDSSGAIAASVGIKMATNGATTDLRGIFATAWVPLTAARTFDYQKTDTTNQGSSSAAISIIGYM